MKTFKAKKSDIEKIRDIAIWAEYKGLSGISGIDEILPGVDLGVLMVACNQVLISAHRGGGRVDGMDMRRMEKILGLDFDMSDMSADDKQATVNRARYYQIEGAGFAWF